MRSEPPLLDAPPSVPLGHDIGAGSAGLATGRAAGAAGAAGLAAGLGAAFAAGRLAGAAFAAGAAVVVRFAVVARLALLGLAAVLRAPVRFAPAFAFVADRFAPLRLAVDFRAEDFFFAGIRILLARDAVMVALLTSSCKCCPRAILRAFYSIVHS